MKQITEISKKELLLFFDYDKFNGQLIWKNHWHLPTVTRIRGKIAGSLDAYGYRCLELRYGNFKVHRLIWFLENDTFPKMIDHINGNPSDNRIENLREVTSRQNAQNRISHRRGKLVGAELDKRDGRWTARIRVGSKMRNLGRFATEKEAHERYVQELENL